MTIGAMHFCDECGAANRSTGKFCMVCGKPLLNILPGKVPSAATGLLTTMTLLKQRYRIGRKLAQGGFGAVYFAEDIVFNAAPRVVKEMSLQVSGSQPLDPQELQQSIEAFKQEALLLASLTHPNLPRIYDHFEEQQHWYIVMDYIEGQTLETMLETAPEGKLDLSLVLHIANQLCTVLNYLHTRQPPIIFRDLKPANIMLTEDDHVYLIDFGIARLFKVGQAKDTVALGTPGYAAPEQFGRAQSTAQTDIYSFGATLHHLLSGRDPSNDPFQFPPLALDQYAVGPGLAALIQRMIAMQKDLRPTSIQEIKQTLQNLSSGNTIKSVTVALSGGDYSSISDAIKNVPEKTRILVRPGTYIESLVLDKNVEIVGDGPREQITLISNDASCIYVDIDSAVVSGMTICGRAPDHYAIDIPRGRFHLSDCIVTCETWSCIGIHNSTAQPLIQHCILRDGGHCGIIIYDQGAGVIEDCDIFANKLRGIEVRTGGKPLVRRCQMHHAQRAGIYVHDQGAGTFEECDIFANTSAGVGVDTGGKPLVRRCKMHDGQEGGILVYDQGEGTFEDCDIFANKLSGVEVRTGGKPLLRRCQIHDGQSIGIVVRDQGEGTFEDCDIFAHNEFQVVVTAGGKPLVRRCQIHDGQAGGIYVYGQGEGIFEDCETFANKDGGLCGGKDPHPMVQRCTFRDGEIRC